jgi:hypothetical protein
VPEAEILISAMVDLQLTRSPDDRRLYVLDGVGTLRLEGWSSRRATAEAGPASWQIARSGFWQRAIEAVDAAGMTVGEFEPNTLRRGGAVRWDGRELTLRPASMWRERYALADGEHELVVLDGKGWGKRPVKVSIEDPAAIEPGLLLFAAFVVRSLAEDAGSAAGASAAVSAAVISS